MTRLADLGEDSRVWIFASPAPLDASRRAALESTIGHFLDGWESHGVRLPAACEILHDRFLVVAADQRTDPSGCSIDKLFRLLHSLAVESGTSLLETHHVFFRDHEGNVQSATRQGFRELADRDEVSASTIVFDTTIDTLDAIVHGRWEKPAGESWHRRLLAS